MKIGSLELPHGLFLAPMAGYTDYAMRRVCREMGAEYLTGEMVSAKAVCFSDRKTIPLARVRADEVPCAVQLFGHECAVMAEAAAVVARGVDGGVAPCAIDINMGCPVHKIVGSGDGSALMRDPHLAEQIVRAVKDAVKIPVTVKIRAGWDGDSVNAPEVARAVEAGGADMVCVHARTRRQGYSGTADYGVIAAVKRAVKIPVVGNGDVRDALSARRLLDEALCDGIMVGRAAVGNPFVFREIAAMLDGSSAPAPTSEERYETALHQLALAIADKGEATAVLESRKQIGEYFSGYRGGAPARAALNQATSLAQVAAILRSVLFPAP
jgi:nifR3 family TIM-barrel protein